MVDPILVIDCDCGRAQEILLSRVIAQPTVECAKCGQVKEVSPAIMKAALQRYGGEVFDLSHWEPQKVRPRKRKPRKRIA